MMECWKVSPGRRPSFIDIAEKCHDLVETSSDRVSIECVGVVLRYTLLSILCVSL